MEMRFIVDSDCDAIRLFNPFALNFKTNFFLDLLGNIYLCILLHFTFIQIDHAIKDNHEILCYVDLQLLKSALPLFSTLLTYNYTGNMLQNPIRSYNTCPAGSEGHWKRVSLQAFILGVKSSTHLTQQSPAGLSSIVARRNLTHMILLLCRWCYVIVALITVTVLLLIQK